MSGPSWLSAIEGVGEAALTAVFPAAAPIIGLVNHFLPADKKLPPSASGSDVASAYRGLTPEQQAQIQEDALQLKMTEVNRTADVQIAMLNSDANNPQTTRPKIAYQAWQVVGSCDIIVIAIWAIGVLGHRPDLVKSVEDSWKFLAVVLGTPTTLLLRYFGVLAVEHANRMAAVNGQPTSPPGIMGGIARIVQGIQLAKKG